MDLCDLALIQDAPLLQNQAVADVLGQIPEVMGHKNEPGASRTGGVQGAGKVSLAWFIQPIEGFVADQQFRIMHERAEQEDLAELAIGHLQNASPGQLDEPKPGEKPFDCPFLTWSDLVRQPDAGEKA